MSHKEILATILKACAEELASSSLTEIMDSIQDVQVSQVPVHREDAARADARPTLVGANTEDETADEGTVRYDILIYVNVPGDDDKAIRVIINIEAQQKDNPGYPLIRRGLYYVSRMISRRKTGNSQKAITATSKRCIRSESATVPKMTRTP